MICQVGSSDGTSSHHISLVVVSTEREFHNNHAGGVKTTGGLTSFEYLYQTVTRYSATVTLNVTKKCVV